jgi:hypothetical protein
MAFPPTRTLSRLPPLLPNDVARQIDPIWVAQLRTADGPLPAQSGGSSLVIT